MGKIFGTFGVRGVYPDFLNEDFALKMARAFGTFLKGLKENPKVVVGRDTRRTGESIKESFVSGLISSGVDVVDVGILPTPLVQYSARILKVDGGAVITASHNPPEYNGIKLLEGNGMGLSRKKEAAVEEIFESGKFYTASWKGVGKKSQKDMKIDYFMSVMERVDANAIASRNPFVVTDEAGGAGALILPELLETLGCKVLSLNSHTSGFFSARNPEPSESNLKDTEKIVKALSPDIAVAQDGDADRAVFMTSDGKFVQGDKTFALVEKFVLSERKGPVVTTVATSNIIDEVAKEFKVEVYRTKVGDLVVTGKLLELGGVIGGEENGGVIFPDLALGRDGIFSTVKIVEAISKSRKTFEELLSELPKFYQIKDKIRVRGDRKSAVLKFAKLLKSEGFTVDLTDGAKVIFDDGWVLVRASGTEPIIRIFSESRIEGKEKEYHDFAISKFIEANKDLEVEI